MVERGEGPRPGSRDNGLRAASYVAVADLDPRVAEALLDSLRQEGIAAYVAPTPGARGGYLEVRLPTNLTDRLYVDETRTEAVAPLLAEQNAEAGNDAAPTVAPAVEAIAPLDETSTTMDVDAAWQQVLASLQSAEPETRPWPASEDVTPGVVGSGSSVADLPELAELAELPPPVDPEDEHFAPPEPPPLPTLRPVTVVSLLAIIGGLVIVITGLDGGDLWWLGVLAIIGGAISLVWHVKDGPPTDSGWDDGAVV